MQRNADPVDELTPVALAAVLDEPQADLLAEALTVKLSEVIFDEALYPRTQHDPQLVQHYAETMDQIEALSHFVALSAENKILDGKHRWLAYRKIHEAQGDPDIRAYRYPVSGWLDAFKLAHALNATHGYQTTMTDKERGAKRFYHYGVTSYDDIAAWLHVGKEKISGWLARTVKEERDKRNEKIKALWLACYTQEEIAKACGCGRDVAQAHIETIVEKVFENQIHKAAASHATDFDPPLYNVWKQQDKSSGVTIKANASSSSYAPRCRRPPKPSSSPSTMSPTDGSSQNHTFSLTVYDFRCTLMSSFFGNKKGS